MIKIIDLKDCNIQTEEISNEILQGKSEELYLALSTLGFLYLKNTGISKTEVNNVLNRLQQFFYLDLEVKHNYKCSKDGHGYLDNEAERINPNRPGDLKETYNMSGGECFRDGASWPDDVLPQFSNQMKSFMSKLGLLARLICKMLAVGMKLQDSEFLVNCHREINSSNNFTSLRGLYYPPLTDDIVIKPNQIRLGEHSDYGSFTFLFQDPIGGLQIEDYAGHFIDVMPIEGTVVLNIGDLMQHWTSGRLKSTVHRVLIPEDEKVRRQCRRSMAYFVNPDNETILKLLQYKPEADPPRFDNTMNDTTQNAKDFLLNKFYKAVT